MRDVVMAPISVGELLDKITILRIKARRILDATKLANVTAELNRLTTVFSPLPHEQAELEALTVELAQVNEALWQIEDDIRDHEHEKNFGASFVELARSVYLQNDRRAEIKKRINLLTGSVLTEEKSYKDYAVVSSGITLVDKSNVQ